MDYNNSRLGIILNAISCLINAFIGGGKFVSISARIGYNYLNNKNIFWSACKWLVDFTFYPLDGKGHCVNAYLNNPNSHYRVDQGFKFGLYVMSLILYMVCVPLSIIFWSHYGIKKLWILTNK
jgi:hypothetical protein